MADYIKGNVNNSGSVNLQGGTFNQRIDSTGSTIVSADLINNGILNSSKLLLNEDVTLTNNNKASFNAGSVWKGSVVQDLDSAILEYNGITENNRVNVSKGKFILGDDVSPAESTIFTVDSNSNIAKEAIVEINKSGSIKLNEGGSLALSSDDTWKGFVLLDGGTLSLDKSSQTGSMKGLSGTFVLGNDGDTKDTYLTINSSSSIQKEVNLIVNKSATLNLEEGEIILKNDVDGTLNVVGGKLVLDGTSKLGDFTMSAGDMELRQNIELTDTNNITGGKITVNQEKTLTVSTPIATAIANKGTIDGSCILTLNNTSINEENANISLPKIIVLNDVVLTNNGVIDTVLENKGTLAGTGSAILNGASSNSGNILGGNITAKDDFSNSGLISNATFLLDNGVVLTNTGTIADDANLELLGDVNLNDGTLNLNQGDIWNGKITLDGTDAVLNYKDLTVNGQLIANSGNLNILDNAVLTANDIEDAVVVNLSDNSKLILENGSFVKSATDTVLGEIELRNAKYTSSFLYFRI